MNIKGLFLIVTFTLLALPAFAQGKGKADMHREFREFKVKYIIQEIELDPDKAREFGEIYLQMEEERHKNFSSTRDMEVSVKGNEKSTDADYARLSEAMVQCKSRDAEISRRYEEKFAKMLTPKQLYKMKDAEESFRRKMQQMRQKRKARKGRPATK